MMDFDYYCEKAESQCCTLQRINNTYLLTSNVTEESFSSHFLFEISEALNYDFRFQKPERLPKPL